MDRGIQAGDGLRGLNSLSARVKLAPSAGRFPGEGSSEATIRASIRTSRPNRRRDGANGACFRDLTMAFLAPSAVVVSAPEAMANGNTPVSILYRTTPSA